MSLENSAWPLHGSQRPARGPTLSSAWSLCRAKVRAVADRMDRAARLSLVLACVLLRARKFRAILDAPASGNARV
jgi:hypothetical protein